MSHDWMNDPELDQLPATDPRARAEQLEQLKQLAEREYNAAEPQLPSHYALSMSELKAARAKQAAASQVAVPATASQASQVAAANQASQVTATQVTATQVAANQGAVPAAPAQATKAAANQEPEKQKSAFAGTQSAAIAQLASSIETLPTAITMFEELGAELGITAATAAIAEVLRVHHALVSSPADPNDRFGMFEFATTLRKDRVRWEEITKRVNEAGYRNRNGGLWKMLSLRRALDRECERRGISLKAMGRRR